MWWDEEEEMYWNVEENAELTELTVSCERYYTTSCFVSVCVAARNFHTAINPTRFGTETETAIDLSTQD